MNRQTENIEGYKYGDGSLLQNIDSPADLRKLKPEQLPELCAEIRDFLISNLSHNPGHFGSSMGAVEIIVALHYVFNTPHDRLVWDVGHQAYAHKILTGRRDAFSTQRTLGGISGFPIPSESEYDTFVCGHAGNSISAALGMAIADMHTPGDEDRRTVALIGDASIGNGLAFEGLNNACNHPNNLLIILNDNDMSIDDNVGALHRYLSNITTSAGYNRWRNKLYKKFKAHGLINEKGKGLLIRFNNSIKSLISRQQNIFEGLNIRYFGPFDGNDVTKMVKVLSEIKDMTGPRILHICTRKGKGFELAEQHPSEWHAPGKFDPSTGEKFKSKGKKAWQAVFGEALVELAERNPEIVGITAAMPSGTSMSKMQEAFPERTFDVGISEGHAVTFAGGLAAAGKKPFVAIYSSFLQRAFDNIIHDVCIQALPVVFCIDRAGIVGEDGVTHHGLFDLSYLRIIPQMTIGVPRTAEALRNLMFTASKSASPFAIRYPRGKSDVEVAQTPFKSLTPGKGEKIFGSSVNGDKIAILTVGPIGDTAVKVAKKIEVECIAADVFDMVWVKPLDEEILREITKNYHCIITVEDGIKEGGFGSAVTEWMSSHNKNVVIKRLGISDNWVTHGSVAQLESLSGYDEEGIEKAIKEVLTINYPEK